MDDLVKAALAKWPNVPDCFGWLALDARGDWYMRDERTQAAGPFPQARGSRIEHEKLRGFIERNYGHDGQGRWYFQNGPQRVYVELEAAPWVWRVSSPSPAAAHEKPAAPEVRSHTSLEVAAVTSCWLDEHGRLFLETPLGLGIVHTLDMDAAADAVERGLWSPQPTTLAELAARFGHCLSPQRRPSTASSPR